MYEKVNPSHPDKVADRIAGALVDYCYQQQRDPRVAVEVLIGHGETTIIAESSVQIPYEQAVQTVERIAGVIIRYKTALQGAQKAATLPHQRGTFDEGVPLSFEHELNEFRSFYTNFARISLELYTNYEH